jgi:hypothetical protein
LLAATAAHASVKTNVKLAVKAYNQIKDTGSIARESFMRHHYSSIHAVIATGKPNGRKSQAFYHALIGDTDSVVVDVWMLRYYGITAKAPNKTQYDTLASRIRAEAIEHGMHARDYQDMLWCKIRGASDSYADHLRQLYMFDK